MASISGRCEMGNVAGTSVEPLTSNDQCLHRSVLDFSLLKPCIAVGRDLRSLDRLRLPVRRERPLQLLTSLVTTRAWELRKMKWLGFGRNRSGERGNEIRRKMSRKIEK